MPIEIKRPEPAPITAVLVREKSGESPLDARPCSSCIPGQFYVVKVDGALAHISREELREWCVGVIEMLDQDAP